MTSSRQCVTTSWSNTAVELRNTMGFELKWLAGYTARPLAVHSRRVSLRPLLSLGLGLERKIRVMVVSNTH